MQEHAWLARLTQELWRDSNSPNQEGFGAGYIHIFKRVFPRGREVFFVPFETGLIYKGASPALVITH